MPVSITTSLRHSPRVPFSRIAQNILGTHYDLSVVIIGDRRMARLNQLYRGKLGTTDVLAFPLAKHSGELFINLREAARRAPRFGMKPDAYYTFLVIHGCLHLKGMDHGPAMEAAEKRVGRMFNISIPQSTE